MVVIDKRHLDESFKEIRLRSNETGGTSVLIFVAPDVDALAAFFILTTLLRSEDIPYSVEPVRDYGDLSRANEDLVKDNDMLRSILFLGCGGNQDVNDVLPELSEDVKVYIIDARRPFHLANVHSEIQVCVFDDHARVEDYPEDLDSSSSDESESDEESEFSDGEGPKRRRSELFLEKRDRKRKKHMALVNYYSGSSYGPSVAGLMYELAAQLSKERDNDILWMAILGLTDQYVHERIRRDNYTLAVDFYYGEVSSMNGDENERGIANEAAPLAERNRIKFEDDYQFMLFRHWSLYESMNHSSFVASRMGIWRAQGKQRLHEMFAEMGIPLEQCKQKFTHMDPKFKNTLRTLVEKHQEKYGLEGVTFASFQKLHEYRKPLTAADKVYALTAILESGGDGDEWKESFWTAYDSLSTSNYESFVKRGVNIGIRLQQAIVRQGTALFEKKQINDHGGPFRWAVLEETGDSDLLTHNQALSKFASFIITTYRIMTRKKPKPLVVCASKGERYMVVGVNAGSKEKNKFGPSFREAAEKTGASVRHEGFDSCIIEVVRDDLQKFVSQLLTQTRLAHTA